MSLHAIVDSPELYIGHDAQNQWLYADWKGEYNQETARAACALLLTSLRVWPCQKILNDNSGITRTTAQLTDWGVRWLDELRAAGLQYIAWVLPRNPLVRRCNEEKVHAIAHPRVSTFDDVASAYAWLQRQAVVDEQLAVCN